MTTASEWSSRVKQWEASGEGAWEFCEHRDFSAKALQSWSSRFRRHGFPKGAGGGGREVALARVIRRAEEVPAGEESAVFIELSGARVRVGVGCSRVVLAMVVDVLRDAASGAR